MVVDLLAAARELYAANPSHAPLGSGCRGYTVCPVLALNVISWPVPAGDRARALRALAASAGITDYEGDSTPRRQIIKWNASSSTEEVLAAFDRAIAAAFDRVIADNKEEK